MKTSIFFSSVFLALNWDALASAQSTKAPSTSSLKNETNSTTAPVGPNVTMAPVGPNATMAPTASPTLTKSSPPTLTKSSPPTLSSKPTISLAPSPRPSSSPSASPSFTCVDSTTHEFKIDKGDTVTCAWLTKNIKNTATRINNYCSRPNVKYQCAKTCPSCREAATCDDVPGFKFQLIWDSTTEVSCDWLTKKLDKVAVRRSNYCDKQLDVATACPRSCGYCPAPFTNSPSVSISPSESPSDSPSGKPSAASSERPSAAPFDQPSSAPSPICLNDNNYEFKTDEGVSVGCSWLTKNLQKITIRKGKYCDRTEVKYKCKAICDKCDEACEDVTGFKFPLKSVDAEKECAWITKNNIEKRREAYCGDVKDSCTKSCGYCGL